MFVSRLRTVHKAWDTASEYQQSCSFVADRFLQVTDLLLENPNLNSTHLFRADVLFDSAHQLKTVSEKERQCQVVNGADVDDKAANANKAEPPSEAPFVKGALLVRKVLRRLIPRKPQLDRPLDQWCYIYKLTETPDIISGYVVLYVPEVEGEADMPWYHPPVKSLAYVYELNGSEAILSIHFLPFSKSSGALPSRLHRTFISLLQTFLRLAKSSTSDHRVIEAQHNISDGTSSIDMSLAPSVLKDTILPQHIVQDTYTRLKQQYAQDLISRWAEKTEPSKHVFEDLSIAAFLIELWKQMYLPGTFPGFIDFACGNGVLTYVLIREGYHGRGFDARRRKTWDVLEMDGYLDEMICIPQPFLDHAVSDMGLDHLRKSGMRIHNGIIEPRTFIISNHADELTPWTPILAALTSPASPLPFLAIPCCSHALNGAKHRYLPKDVTSSSTTTSIKSNENQPATGDLRALRAAKIKAANHADDKSMYACLTKKVVALAQEVGCDVEMTLMRIPSTRNIGVVGNRRRTFAAVNVAVATALIDVQKHMNDEVQEQEQTASTTAADDEGREKIERLLSRECAMSGGITEAARCWIERAQKLQKGQGRGKVNLGKSQNRDLSMLE